MANAKLLTQEHDAVKEVKERQRSERKKVASAVHLDIVA